MKDNSLISWLNWSRRFFSLAFLDFLLTIDWVNEKMFIGVHECVSMGHVCEWTGGLNSAAERRRTDTAVCDISHSRRHSMVFTRCTWVSHSLSRLLCPFNHSTLQGAIRHSFLEERAISNNLPFVAVIIIEGRKFFIHWSIINCKRTWVSIEEEKDKVNWCARSILTKLMKKRQVIFEEN